MDNQTIQPNNSSQQSEQTPTNGSSFSQAPTPNSGQYPPSFSTPGTPTEKSKKKSGKRFLFNLLVLLLLVGGAAAYFLVIKKETTTSPAATTPAPQTESTPVLPDNRLFYQLGAKVIAYDTKTKKAETITEKIPVGSTVLDFYSDSTTWRLYASKQIESKTSFLYLEKGKNIETVEENNDGVISYKANAKNRIVAFTVIAPNDPKKKEMGTRTFVVKDGNTEMVYESAPLTQDSDKKGLKDPRYLLVDISSDAKKLLFNRANCLYCDGGHSATSFELDLDTKKTTSVFTAKKTNGSIEYAEEGYLIDEGNASGLGFSNDPMVRQFTELDEAAGTPKTVFSINEADWAMVDLDNTLDLIVVETRLQNYAQTGRSAFDGLYSVEGATSNDIKKLKIANGPAFEDLTLVLGAERDDCYATQATTRNFDDKTHVLEIGVLCKKDASTFTYSKIDTTAYKVNESPAPSVKLLN